MSRPPRVPTAADDPLRMAREAVKGGQFRAALNALIRVESSMGTSPEWLLLSAVASWRVGQFQASHQSARRALAAYREQGDGDGEMRAQNVAAAGDFALGNLSEAQAGFERALQLARRFNDRLMMARCANNLGNVAYYLGDNAKALHHYSHAATLFEQVGSLSGATEAWHNRAVVLREEGDLARAQEAADRAMDAAQMLGDQRAIGWTLGGSAETDAMRGDLRLGWARAERAANLARNCEDRLTEIDSIRVMAYIARHEGDIGKSVELARSAVSLASATGNPWMLARASEQLGQSLEMAGLGEEAGRAWATAATAFERTGAHARARAARDALSRN